MTDLVWLATGFIGDLVLATGAMAVAAKAFPQARQHAVTTPAGAQALAGVPELALLTVFDKRSGALAPMLAARRALRIALAAHSESGKPSNALLLQPHLSMCLSLLARLTGLSTITYEETSGGGHAERPRVPRVALLHEAARIALLLEPLGVPRQDLVAAMSNT